MAENEVRGSATAGRKALLPVVIGVVVGVLIGAPTGALVGAPIMVKKITGETAAAESTESESPEAPRAVYLLDDIVLNPAGTEGTRYLIARVAIEGKGEGFEAAMQARDAEVRDVVVRLLGSRSVSELADVARREGVKKELLSTLVQRFPKERVQTVYFPQFVIQ